MSILRNGRSFAAKEHAPEKRSGALVDLVAVLEATQLEVLWAVRKLGIVTVRVS
jgi:hypothetical protein